MSSNFLCKKELSIKVTTFLCMKIQLPYRGIYGKLIINNYYILSQRSVDFFVFSFKEKKYLNVNIKSIKLKY